MSRILVLLPVALWFVWVDARAGDGRVEPLGVVLFLGGLALAVLVLAYAAGRAARREARGRSARQRVFRVARALVLPITLVWFGYALFFLGWGEAVRHLVERPTLPPLVAPGMFLATLPVYLTWALLLAAEYPVIRQRRESRLLIDLNDGRPVHSPPPAWRYWVGALRQRLLFALVPLALLMVLRDTALFALWAMGASSSPGIEAGLFVASALLIIALSPELIRRLLPTRPLPAGPLRDRLERMGQRTGLPMRDVLVWDTDSTMVNAAVIGFLPGLRYVLVSDLLLESMSPIQVEAVFAHEIGHVRHRHVVWYFIFLVGMTLFLGGPVEALWRWLVAQEGLEMLGSRPAQYVVGFGSLGAVLVLFGLLSRLFEREADVYAARTMQAIATPPAGGTGIVVREVAVGPEGAMLFGSSLEQAARLNHVPLSRSPTRRGALGPLAWVGEELTHFLHGTIRSRISYLMRISQSSSHTRRFDYLATAAKLGVLALVIGSGAFVLAG